MVVVNVSAALGPISVKVSCPNFPQSVAGVIWRFNEDKTFDAKAGAFQTQVPSVPLGAPETIDDKLFLIEGAVLHQNDNPPTPYQVLVSILQGSNLLHEAVPSKNGSGKISDTNIPFVYRFGINIT